MVIYYVRYSMNDENVPNIEVEETVCRETEKSICWKGHRLPKEELDHINVYGSPYHLSLSTYLSSEDKIIEFENQIMVELDVAVMNIDDANKLIDLLE